MVDKIKILYVTYVLFISQPSASISDGEEKHEGETACNDEDEELETDEGPDVEGLIDRMVTLCPRTKRPTDMPEDNPPELPPKKKHHQQQNGEIKHTTENGGIFTNEEKPPMLPPKRREKKETVNLFHNYLFIFF